MSDPAVEAAQRAWENRDWSDQFREDYGTASAREALEPIRELIEKWEAPTSPFGFSNGNPASTTHIAADFIEELRQLVHTEEELT